MVRIRDYLQSKRPQFSGRSSVWGVHVAGASIASSKTIAGRVPPRNAVFSGLEAGEITNLDNCRKASALSPTVSRVPVAHLVTARITSPQAGLECSTTHAEPKLTATSTPFGETEARAPASPTRFSSCSVERSFFLEGREFLASQRLSHPRVVYRLGKRSLSVLSRRMALGGRRFRSRPASTHAARCATVVAF